MPVLLPSGFFGGFGSADGWIELRYAAFAAMSASPDNKEASAMRRGAEDARGGHTLDPAVVRHSSVGTGCHMTDVMEFLVHDDQRGLS
jgi:hypothetical protein